MTCSEQLLLSETLASIDEALQTTVLGIAWHVVYLIHKKVGLAHFFHVSIYGQIIAQTN
jgi:hypothetical protein